MDKSEWQARSHPYMTRMMATGRFPTLSKVLLDTASPLSSDTLFEQGLDCVLDGIGVQLERRSSKRKREQKR